MIAQEDSPLAALRNVGCLLHDLDDRVAVFLGDRHIHARHQREVISHVALVALTEVLSHVLRPHIGLGEQEAVLVLGVDRRTQLLDDHMRFRQVLVAGAIALDQVGYRVQAEAVHAQVEPKAHSFQNGFHHSRVVEIQVWLMTEKAMPEILFGYRIPSPV